MGKAKRFIPVKTVVALLVVGSLILIVGIIMLPVFNAILHSELKTIMPMSKTASTLSTWEDPRDSVDMVMEFYFFDLQNPDEVLQGAKPIVIEKGPYAYQEIKVKQNVTFDTAHSTATYIEPRTLVFNRSRSIGSENDTFTTINVPLIAVVTMIQASPAGEEILNFAINDGFIRDENAFKRLSVYQLIWGYKDNLMTDVALLLKILGMTLPIPVDGYFGFLYKKNNTDDGVYTVNTGQGDLSRFMEVEQWNHNSTLSFWKTKYCNMINGTDGTAYHPFVEKTDKLFLFSSDLARSIDVVFDSEHFLQDIPQYRFKPPQSLFGYPPDNYDNACYCLGSGGCPHNGVLNISAVQEGAPVFVSQPHFLNGDYYRSTVVGMHPNDTLHNTYIDVEPTTGIVMQGAKRLQMNLVINKNPYVRELANIPSMLFPLLWLDESALINDKGLQTFKDMFFNLQQGVMVASYILIVIGAGMVVLTLLYVLVKYRDHKRSQNQEHGETTPITGGATSASYQSVSGADSDKDWAKMMRDD